MYSVIIQNHNMMKEFQDYYPLFVELFQSGNAGCCEWKEFGEDVTTALPGLTDLIEGKKQWRAVVVRSLNLEEDGSYDYSTTNPYDYLLNSRKKILSKNREQFGDNDSDIFVPVEESPVPLIRLSQMLGGVPSPELKFIPTIIRDEDDDRSVPRKIFKPEQSEEDRAKYNELVHKYDFDGVAPSEVIFITLKNAEPKSIREDTKAKCVIRKETEESTDFCRRNRYAASTRFLVYDYFSQGKIQKEADMFNFWTCVMLMAREDISPSSLQAYRIYNVKASFNLEDMKECFQDKVEQLRGCKNYIEREIRSEIERRMSDKHPAPPYKMSVPVSPEMVDESGVRVNYESFPFCPSSMLEEKKMWKALRSGSEKSLKHIYIQSERALDESSVAVRSYCRYEDSDIKNVDKYDRREMELELSNTFDDIIHMQTELSSIKNRTNERSEEAAKEVVGAMNERMEKPIAGCIGVLLLAGIILSCIPGALFIWKYGYGSWKGIVFSVLFMACFLVAAVLMLLWLKKRNLEQSIDGYNEAMRKNVEELSFDMSRFAEFVSNIVSHCRGRNYLMQLEAKKFDSESDIPVLQLHLRSINKMLEKLSKWTESYHITLIEDTASDREYHLNYGIRPQSNALYTFETGENYKIPLNDQGDHVYSPFRFIDGLNLEREEIFNDE
ncbi:MAG: hypothetical protein K5871_08940 [Lachnospiraceae bacterium]|nr:hypothetical protein [Lachnospiraceae bacterium]